MVPPGTRGYARQVPVPQAKSISQTEYELRRTLLVDKLPEGSVCVLIGAGIKYASDSVLYASSPPTENLGNSVVNCSYPFHQDPNFFYLTGFVEKNALAVIGIIHNVPG
jgi:intermediate cleaving peptidase 55